MNGRRARELALVITVLTALLTPSFFAQTKEKKRPKLKEFGSSIRRNKWDPVKQQAVDTKEGDPRSRSSADDIVQIETNLVSSDILVVDGKGNLINNLTADDFVITEDGEPQEVGHFRRGDNASIPRTIVLIIDYSCTQLPVLRGSIDAAKLLVDKLGPLDTMAIVTDDVELIVDFTNDKSKLKKKLESVYERPNTIFDPTIVTDWHTWGKGLQYTALMATLKEAFIDEDLRPIIIFQTSGSEVHVLRNSVLTDLPPDLPEDLRAELLKTIKRNEKYRLEHHISDFSLEDVYRAVDRSRATIYTVVPDYRFLNRSLEQQMKLMTRRLDRSHALALSQAQDYWRKKRVAAEHERWRPTSSLNLMWWAEQEQKSQEALAAIAPRTGGWTEFLEAPEDAEGIYNRILNDINHRYIVGYYSKNKAHDGTQRRIKFQIRRHPEYYILARASYYAPNTINPSR